MYTWGQKFHSDLYPYTTPVLKYILPLMVEGWRDQIDTKIIKTQQGQQNSQLNNHYLEKSNYRQ